MEKGNDYDENTIEIKGLLNFLGIIGSYRKEDKFTHLGYVPLKLTSCGKRMGNIILRKDVTVNCPECVAEMRQRSDNPEDAKRKFGVVTHKMK